MIGFGKFSKKQAETATIITELTDRRLILINPQEEGFFDAVLNFRLDNDYINAFIEAVEEVKDEKLEVFYKTIYDPSEDGDEIVYKKGNKPAAGHSYNWWVEKASKMPAVEGRQWKLASEYQYYAFLVWLINQLVKSGKSVEEALNQVLNDSNELGHYRNSENSTKSLEDTGSRRVCGVYDLANTYKILRCSNKAGDFWHAGGDYSSNGDYRPLAYLNHYTCVAYDDNHSVGLLVL